MTFNHHIKMQMRKERIPKKIITTKMEEIRPRERPRTRPNYEGHRNERVRLKETQENRK